MVLGDGSVRACLGHHCRVVSPGTTAERGECAGTDGPTPGRMELTAIDLRPALCGALAHGGDRHAPGCRDDGPTRVALQLLRKPRGPVRGRPRDVVGSREHMGSVAG